MNMERHFPIKPGQPIGMALSTFYSFSEFPNWGKEPVYQIWNGEFRSEYSNRYRWSTTEHSGRKKPKRTFPFEFRPKFPGSFRHNGKHPKCASAPSLLLLEIRSCENPDPWYIARTRAQISSPTVLKWRCEFFHFGLQFGSVLRVPYSHYKFHIPNAFATLWLSVWIQSHL